MGTIHDLVKDRTPYSVNADDSVMQAVHMMVDKNIGAVAVLRDGELVGVFSERDLMKRVVAAGRGPGSTQVSEVMTPRPRTVSPNETFENCMVIMREHGFRHRPVVEAGQLFGLVSLRDLLLHAVDQ
ncbi:MAG: CBS domain-containing protein, partial [Terriglobales bacterium]